MNLSLHLHPHHHQMITAYNACIVVCLVVSYRDKPLWSAQHIPEANNFVEGPLSVNSLMLLT